VTRLRRPEWMQSIRFRLSLLYSSLVFGVSAMVVGAIYFGLRLALERQPVFNQLLVSPTYTIRNGQIVTLAKLQMTEVESLERLVNEQTLGRLAAYSFAALGALFCISLLIGWIVSGRALRPIHQITGVAREIQATDLSRRIDLQGPPDEMHRLADTFDQMLDRLDEGFEEQRQFIADVSHDLRNPLAVIQTNVEVALDDLDATTAEWRHTGEIVRTTAGRMSGLVDDLLATARQQHRRVARETVPLGELVTEVATEMAAAGARSGITLEPAPDEPVPVTGDRGALKRALANLVDNAIRVSPSGAPVSIRAGRRDRWAWLSVADRGPGIAPEQLEHVFTRYHRVDASDEDGTHLGLGLAIVKEVAAAHGGDVHPVANANGGTTFTMWLPLDPDAAGTPPPAADAAT
jgi:signal transduction histidine kinase